jgi:Fibronectin type III domain
MSLIDIMLQRRSRSGSPTNTVTCRPQVELLEERQCLSVAAPTGLHLSALSSTQVKLTWNDVAHETGFRIYQWDGTQTLLLKTVAKGVTTFTASNLKPDMTQMFRVEAFDLTTSAKSAWASIVTPADPITVPTNVRISNITQTSMTVQWNNASGATSYNVFGWDGTRSFLIGSTTRAVPAFVVSGLAPGITYFFYVQSVNNTNSANSDWVSATTISPNLTAPGQVKAQVLGASTIALSWNNVVNAAGYRIYIWNGVSSTTPAVVTVLAPNTTGFQVTGLLPGEKYWFYVQAFNGSHVANSPWVTATTIAAVPLQPPTQLTVGITGPNSVMLTWVEPARAVAYRVFVWTGVSWTQVLTEPAGTHQVPITGLASGQTQWFFVEAYTDNFAEISYSSAVFANL